MNPFKIARAFMASPRFRFGLIAIMFGSGMLYGLAAGLVVSLIILLQS